jgi:hypothetical protein
LDDIINFVGTEPMADHFASLYRGADNTIVWTTSSTSAADLEVRVADAAGWTRDEVKRALERIIDKLVANNDPDADSKSVKWG